MECRDIEQTELTILMSGPDRLETNIGRPNLVWADQFSHPKLVWRDQFFPDQFFRDRSRYSNKAVIML